MPSPLPQTTIWIKSLSKEISIEEIQSKFDYLMNLVYVKGKVSGYHALKKFVDKIDLKHLVPGRKRDSFDINIVNMSEKEILKVLKWYGIYSELNAEKEDTIQL